ncbi:MAG: hypothetical protein HKN37_05425, partial [Rhodothermales bacterium]|nr:hypothetical protein [Rhodothermales bacterium]
AYERCSEVAQQSGNDVGSAIASANVGEVLINQRRFDEAEPMLESALRVLRASGHLPAMSFVESELARLSLRRGDLLIAESLLLEMRDRSAAAGEALNVLNATLLLAEVKLDEGDLAAAQEFIDNAGREGDELLELFGPTLGRLRARVAAGRGHTDQALDEIELALEQARAQAVLYEQALLLMAKAEISVAAGRGVDIDESSETDRLIDELGIRREPVQAT